MLSASVNHRTDDASRVVKHSGILCADLDKVTQALGDKGIIETKVKLRANEHVLAAFTSPSGDGLKVLFRVPADEATHYGAFLAAKELIHATTGLAIDDACKDVVRFCFASYDPNLYVNPDATMLDTIDDKVIELPVAAHKVQPANTGNGSIIDQAKSNVEAFEPAIQGQDGSGRLYRVACILGVEFDLNDADAMLAIADYNSRCQPAWNEKEILHKLSDARKNASPRDFGKQVAGRNRHGLVRLLLPGGEQSITDAAMVAFEILSKQEVYIQGDRVVALERNTNPKLSSIKVLHPEAFRSMIERSANTWVMASGRGGKRVQAPKPCSLDQAKSMLFCSQARDRFLPRIKSVSASPLIVDEGEGGTRILDPGFDEKSGVYVLGNMVIPDVEFTEAKAKILETLIDFKFDSNGDKARAIACIITPALKMGGFIKRAIPFDAAQANASQAGKGYRQTVLAAIYGEENTKVTIPENGVGGLSEAFGTALSKLRPFVQLDNLRGRLASQVLESFATANGDGIPFQVRVPHTGYVQVDPSMFFVSLTSNGLDATPDLANRCCIINITKQPEGYAYHRFDDGYLEEHVQANQPLYLGCVFSIIKEWVRQGKKTTRKARHDFREWFGILDEIVTNYFGLGELMDGHREAQQNASLPVSNFLKSVCKDLALQEPEVTVRETGLKKWDFTALDLVIFANNHDIELPENPFRSFEDSAALGKSLKQPFDEAPDNSITLGSWTISRRIEKVKGEKSRMIPKKTYCFALPTS